MAWLTGKGDSDGDDDDDYADSDGNLDDGSSKVKSWVAKAMVMAGETMVLRQEMHQI